MEFKFNISDRVVVLDGSNIPQYTGSWPADRAMDALVGKEFIIVSRYHFDCDRNGYEVAYPDGSWCRFTFDERGLRLVNDTDEAEREWVEYQHGHIRNNGQTFDVTVMTCHNMPFTPYSEMLPDGESRIMSEEPFVRLHGRFYRVSTLESSVFFICPDCGRLHVAESGTRRFDGKLICTRCRDNYYVRCEDCGELHLSWNAQTVNVGNGQLRTVCDHCIESSGHYVRCQECGRIYPVGYAFTEINGQMVCELCAMEYHPCPTCGRFTRSLLRDPRTGEEIFCPECYVEPEKFINGYHHLSRRELKKHGVGPCYIGTELEVEKVNSDYWERNDTAGEVIEKLDSRVYCERDGSLFDGFEIISEPHTVEEYFKLKWEDTLQYLIDNGYTSHNNGRCGLHIHFSNEWFGDDEDEIDDNVAKVIHLYSKEYGFFLKCSRRSARQADEWASRYVCDDFEDAKANKSGSRGHHVAVNLDNMTSFGTVEFRLGRGTLIWDSYKAWIDIHIAIVKNSRIVPKDCTDLNLWLNGISEETKAYIKERTDIDIESEVA